MASNEGLPTTQFWIDREPISGWVKVYLIQRDFNNRYTSLGYRNKETGELEMQRFNMGDVIDRDGKDPLIEFSSDMWLHFLQACIKEANENGIKTSDQTAVEAELKATKGHLEDMRLAFNKLLNQ